MLPCLLKLMPAERLDVVYVRQDPGFVHSEMAVRTPRSSS